MGPYFGIDRFDEGGHLEVCMVTDVQLFSTVGKSVGEPGYNKGT